MPDICYEDSALIVCRKPAGLAVQSASFGKKDLESMVKTWLFEKTGKTQPYLGIIHRLDQPVQGLVVFACSKKAAASLSAQVQDGRMKKDYLAVVDGVPDKKEGVLVNYLKKEGRTNTSHVVSRQTPGGKKASLSYRLGEQREGKSLLEIRLETGRHHQIRVQMAAAGFPLAGDVKYNPQAEREMGLGLCANRLELVHPETGKSMIFTCHPMWKYPF